MLAFDIGALLDRYAHVLWVVELWSRFDLQSCVLEVVE